MSVVIEPTTRNMPLCYGGDSLNLLAGNPHLLFTYWEISRQRIDAFIREYGQEQWDQGYPVLKITNVTCNEFFYVRINDFSDSWYIHVPQSDSLYEAELGRKLKDGRFIGLIRSNRSATPCDTMSSNTNACFIDTRTKPVIDAKALQAILQQKSETPAFPLPQGELLQSVEWMENLGLSSAQYNEKGLMELLGISSERILKG